MHICSLLSKEVCHVLSFHRKLVRIQVEPIKVKLFALKRFVCLGVLACCDDHSQVSLAPWFVQVIKHLVVSEFFQLVDLYLVEFWLS
jgi:hypothetical protein